MQKYVPERIITRETALEELGLSSLERIELMIVLSGTACCVSRELEALLALDAAVLDFSGAAAQPYEARHAGYFVVSSG
jgi:hypothetical protein